MSTDATSKAGAPPSLDVLIRHAEKFGSECIYETAVEFGLPGVELGYLARHLRRVDRYWKLTPQQKYDLIVGLLSEDVPDREIRDMAKVSQDTVARTRKGSETSDSGVVSPVTMRREVRKSGEPRRFPGPVDSGASDGSEAVLETWS
jgi:hypothetical protein